MGAMCAMKHIRPSNPTKCSEIPEKQKLKQAPRIRRPPPPQPPTKIKISDIDDPVERAGATRKLHLDQLERRFRGNDLVKSSETAWSFFVKPTDPDFPFELEKLDLQLEVPLTYPLRQPTLFVTSSAIPTEIRKALSSAWNRKASVVKGQLSLLDMMKWLDNNLESLLSAQNQSTVFVTIVKDQVHSNAQSETTQELTQCPEGIGKFKGGDEGDDEDKEDDDEGDAYEMSENEGHEESEPPSQSQPVIDRGTQIKLPDILLTNISLLECTLLNLLLHCSRCSHSVDVVLVPNSPKEMTCPTCSTHISINYRANYIHVNSICLGFLDVEGCVPFDLLPSTFVATCSDCDKTTLYKSLLRGKAISASCQSCHARLTLMVDSAKFSTILPSSATRFPPLRPKKQSLKQLGVQFGQSLPENGTCLHYKKSYRWFRFPCCGKLFPCDTCHEVQTPCEIRMANRQVCGFCSKEQPINDECMSCFRILKKAASTGGFWEGGKGTRSQQMMSRKDDHKFAGLTKTMSRREREKRF